MIQIDKKYDVYAILVNKHTSLTDSFVKNWMKEMIFNSCEKVEFLVARESWPWIKNSARSDFSDLWTILPEKQTRGVGPMMLDNIDEKLQSLYKKNPQDENVRFQ